MQSGCNSSFLVCTETGRKDCSVTSNAWHYSGGYINVEFARDVMIQTQYYNTSQENIALYLHQHFNSPAVLKAFGKPYCFVNTGIHDVMIRHITKEVFVENVEWYLRLLRPECHRIVWISTTPPRSDKSKFAQRINQTLEWNMAALDMLNSRADLHIPYIDVFHASLNFSCTDNVHLTPDWYSALASLVGDLLDVCTGTKL